MQGWRGILTFYLKNFKDVTFQITSKGKLGIFYPEEIETEKLLDQVKPLLVKADGSPAEITSLIKEPSKLKDAKKQDDPSQKTLNPKNSSERKPLPFSLFR